MTNELPSPCGSVPKSERVRCDNSRTQAIIDRVAAQIAPLVDAALNGRALPTLNLLCDGLNESHHIVVQVRAFPDSSRERPVRRTP